MLTPVAVLLLGGAGRPRDGRTVQGPQPFHTRGRMWGTGRGSELVGRLLVVWSGTLEGTAEQSRSAAKTMMTALTCNSTRVC